MNWGLAFSHPNWTLARGQKFPIVLSFDGRNTFNVDGVMMSPNAVLVPMPDNSGLIKSFRAAKTMSAFAQGSLFQFSLDGTSILLPALVSCVKTVNSGGIAAAGDFTAPLIAAKTAKQAPPPTAASSLQPNIPQEGSAEYQLEAMQIASNFILKASLECPSILESVRNARVGCLHRRRLEGGERYGVRSNHPAAVECIRSRRCSRNHRQRCEGLQGQVRFGAKQRACRQ